jgi:hypothetical protein
MDIIGVKKPALSPSLIPESQPTLLSMDFIDTNPGNFENLIVLKHSSHSLKVHSLEIHLVCLSNKEQMPE